MKKIIKKYFGVIFFYTSIVFLMFAVTNYLEQTKSADSQISYHNESAQYAFVK